MKFAYLRMISRCRRGYIPADDILYFADKESGSFKQVAGDEPEKIEHDDI